MVPSGGLFFGRVAPSIENVHLRVACCGWALHGFQPGWGGILVAGVDFLGLTLGPQSQMDSPAHGPGDGVFGATWKSAR